MFGFFAEAGKGAKASRKLISFFICGSLGESSVLFSKEGNEMIKSRFQRSPDFTFVVRGGDHNQVELGEDGHVLSARPDAADEIHLVVG